MVAQSNPDAAGASRGVAVFGLGNPIMGDDGLGPLVAQRLEAEYEFPDDVVVADLGMPGPDLASRVCGMRRVIVVDTILAAGSPGELRILDRDAILASDDAGPRVSRHEPGLGDALRIADLFGDPPDEVMLIGIIPGRMDLGAPFSPAIAAAEDRVIGAVLAALQEVGVTPRRRDAAVQVDLQWSRELARPTARTG